MCRILSKSLVSPILVYCSSAWSHYTKVSARKIEQIQRRAAEMVENIKYVSYSDCIIGIPTLQFRRHRADMIEVYKFFSAYEDIDMECFFTVDSDSYTRGHPLK